VLGQRSPTSQPGHTQGSSVQVSKAVVRGLGLAAIRFLSPVSLLILLGRMQQTSQPHVTSSLLCICCYFTSCELSLVSSTHGPLLQPLHYLTTPARLPSINFLLAFDRSCIDPSMLSSCCCFSRFNFLIARRHGRQRGGARYQLASA
jgi:hypothetical protein